MVSPFFTVAHIKAIPRNLPPLRQTKTDSENKSVNPDILPIPVKASRKILTRTYLGPQVSATPDSALSKCQGALWRQGHCESVKVAKIIPGPELAGFQHCIHVHIAI